MAISPSSAWAQSEGASSNPDEIIVTARFRNEAIQDTPIAITAVSGDDLLKRGGTDITAVAQETPSLYLSSGGTSLGKSASVSIRGIGEGDYNFAVEPAVGMYVDDTYHATVFGSLFDLLDIERVEVLRGPQGTLFGKNTAGGAVRMITNKPKGDNSATLQIGMGSYDRYDMRGSADMSIIEDRLMVRVAGLMRQRDGYMTVLDFACANPTLVGPMTGDLSYVLQQKTTADDCQLDTMGGESVYSGRVSVLAVLSDDIELLLSGDYTHDGGEQAPFKLVSISSNLTNFNNNIAIPRYGIPYDSRFLTNSLFTTYAGFKAPVSGLLQPNVSEVDSWGLNGTLDWRINDSVALKSITSYRTYDGEFNRDGDGSPLDMGGSRTFLTHEQFSQELRLSGEALKDRLYWTLGAFYFDSSGRDQSEVDIPTVPSMVLSDDPVSNTSYAAYMHLTYELVDGLNLSGGLRYSDEKKSYTFNRAYYPSLVTYLDDEKGEVSYSRWDWKAGIDYQLTDDVMVYGSVSTGFRAGGFNPRPLTAAQVTTVLPETLTSYEVGAKGDFFDRLLRINVATYQSDYNNLQLTASTQDNNGVLAIIRTNVGKSRVRGVEAEASIRPVDGLRLGGVVGHVDYKYLDLGTAATVAGGPCLNCVPVRSPKWNYALSGTYTADLEKRGSLEFDLRYNYRSEAFFNLNNTSSQPGFGLLNASIAWTSQDEDWRVALNVTNLADKEYYSSLAAGSSAGISGTPGRPREWYLSVSRAF